MLIFQHHDVFFSGLLFTGILILRQVRQNGAYTAVAHVAHVFLIERVVPHNSGMNIRNILKIGQRIDRTKISHLKSLTDTQDYCEDAYEALFWLIIEPFYMLEQMEKESIKNGI